MKKKYIGSIALLSLAAVSLASCGSSTRNAATPTGSLDLTKVVATANDGKYELKNDLYYNKLRYNGNSLVTDKIKEFLYADELAAIKNLFNSTSLADLTADTKTLLVPTKDNVKLFELDGTELLNDTYVKAGCANNYDVLKTNLENSINGSLSTAVFSTQDSETIENNEKNNEKDFNKSLDTFIVASARKGITVTREDLKVTYPDKDNDLKYVHFTNIKTDKFAKLISSYLLSEAEKLGTQNALYQIADQEYIKEYNAEEDDEKTKNSFYLFKEDNSTIEDSYESSYQTFGTYHAVLIQFNSRKEAFDIVKKVEAETNINFSNITDLETAKTAYKALYNTYYEYKKVDSLDDDTFTYVNNLYKNDFSNLSEGVTTLIKTTLEDNEWLTEPRNINNKYVMAIRLDTQYDVSGDENELKWSELDAEQKKLYTTRIKYNTLTATVPNYTSTNYKSMVYTRSNNDDKEDDIFIYDPLFEQKFYSSYSTEYVVIDKAKFKNDVIVEIDDKKYTVADFYNDASTQLSNTIITNYFELEYAYTFYDDYVDSDTHDANVESVTNAINEFTAGNNSSMDKELGVETFLLNSYGYTNKDDVVKYFYDASTCLSSYTAKKVFEDWAKYDSENSKYVCADNIDTQGILYNLLNEGNAKYSELFNINLDHFLINIDDDGDGKPDDPAKFLSEMTDEEKADFENAVVELARALYTETLDPAYDNNSLFKILTFIKSQYEEGAQLKSAQGKTWDDFKKYNFLLTVEQLASSGDITQATVSNFVVPFADYVKGVFSTCVANSVSTSFSNGKFYYYNTVTKEGNVMSSADDITIDTLCETVYGYHVLILNSYSKAKETKYTTDDDSSSVQANIQLLIKEDEDDSSKNVYITTDSYNEEKNKVSFNQFFIYYIQKANGVESSLSSNISTLLSSMYDDVISTYTSSNFQQFLLIKKLDIKSSVEAITNAVAAEKNYYANVVCNYAKNADPKNDGNIYYAWVFGDLDWTRPEK